MSRVIDLRPILNRTPLGAYRWRVVLACWLIAVLDGFDVQSMAFVAPVLAPQWNIPRSVLGQVLTAGVVGLLLGSLVAGRLCDRYGRRPVLLAAVLIVSTGSLLSVLTTNVPELIATRVLTGIGLGGVIVACLALTAEYAPDRLRAAVVTAMYVGFPIGGSVAGVLAAPIMEQFGWQGVFVVGGMAPMLLIALLWRFIPESLRFSVVKGDDPRRIAAVVSRVDPQYVYVPGDRFIAEATATQRANIAQLFVARWRTGTLLLWVICFANLLVLYLLINWLPSILAQSGAALSAANLTAVVFNVGGIVGALTLGFAVDRLDTAKVLAAAYLFAALSVWWLAHAQVTTHVFLMTALAGAGVMGGQFCITALATTFYPTQIRSTGVGAALGIGRIGSLCGPLIGGWALAAGAAPAQIFTVLALPMLACGLAAVVLAGTLARRYVAERADAA